MSDSTPKPFAFTEQAAARDAEDARRRARRAIADTCGPESARTVPFDTGTVHDQPRRPTVAEVRDLYPSYAARGAWLIPLLRQATR